MIVFSESRTIENPYNYGDQPTPSLLRIFKKHGSNPKTLMVSILGGGYKSTTSVENIARAHIRCAHDWVKKLRLKVSKGKTFFNHGIKIKMNTDSGDIYISKMESEETAKLSQYDIIAIGSSTGGGQRLLAIYLPL